jgi:hypothetical protein
MLRLLTESVLSGLRGFFTPTLQSLCLFALLNPAMSAVLNWVFAGVLKEHPQTLNTVTGIVFVGGRLCDPPLYQAVAERQIQGRHFTRGEITQRVGYQLGLCSLATATYAALLYGVYITSLGLQWNVGLAVSGAVSLSVLTILYPTVFLLVTLLVLNNCSPTWVAFLQRNVGAVREAGFAITATLLAYLLIGPST